MYPVFESAYSSGHIQVSRQNLNRKTLMMSTPSGRYATDGFRKVVAYHKDLYD